MRRLEIIADTFLSMNAPVQHALPRWLASRDTMQRQIRERVQENLRALDQAIADEHGLERLACEGGWYATVRIPPGEDDEPTAVRLLEKGGVAVHPGGFFGFRERNRLVLSLLPQPAAFADGVAAMVESLRPE
jgi:alanine-synthesizing transaminase